MNLLLLLLLLLYERSSVCFTPAAWLCSTT
jgi:hypothetical protein